MKLHPNEFVGLILKDREPWTDFKGYPLDHLVTSMWMRDSNPRSQVSGPWTWAIASNLCASPCPSARGPRTKPPAPSVRHASSAPLLQSAVLLRVSLW